MLKVIVDRSRWFRGKGPGPSELLREDGQMCCLGFACLAAGLSEDDIRGVKNPGPEALQRDIPATLSKLRNYDDIRGISYICGELMVTNDSRYLEEIREDRIKELGKKVGLDFEFIGE